MRRRLPAALAEDFHPGKISAQGGAKVTPGKFHSMIGVLGFENGSPDLWGGDDQDPVFL